MTSKLEKKLSPQLIKLIKIFAWTFVGLATTVYCVFLVLNDLQKIVSICGIFGFVALSYLLSVHKKQVQWNQVILALLIQFIMANFVLKTTIGRHVFQYFGDKVTIFLNFTDNGSRFIFGDLVLQGIFAFKVLPVIIFFSFTVSILYYYGVMQLVVMKLGWFLQISIGTTACESLSAAGNIFLGMTESPLLVKPYLSILTKSELFAIMTGGFSTIAGSVLAAYINFGINAGHLISASVMAAPASLGISKLIYPETEESLTRAEDIKLEKGAEHNALEAGANGASQAVKLCAHIAANLIALMAFLAFLDAFLGAVGSLCYLDGLSFESILSRLFIPFALMMGVTWEDSQKVANLLGLKIFMSEFIAYRKLSDMQNANILSPRSEAIATFALCGFANICSMGIQIGGLGALAPKRKSELAGMAFRSMLAGSLVTFLNACLAGLLYSDDLSIPHSNTTLLVT